MCLTLIGEVLGISYFIIGAVALGDSFFILTDVALGVALGDWCLGDFLSP